MKKEKHIMILPSTDRTLAQLTGAKVFSKLDANSGFWQVELSEAEPSGQDIDLILGVQSSHSTGQ